MHGSTCSATARWLASWPQMLSFAAVPLDQEVAGQSLATLASQCVSVFPPSSQGPLTVVYCLSSSVASDVNRSKRVKEHQTSDARRRTPSCRQVLNLQQTYAYGCDHLWLLSGKSKVLKSTQQRRGTIAADSPVRFRSWAGFTHDKALHLSFRPSYSSASLRSLFHAFYAKRFSAFCFWSLPCGSALSLYDHCERF
jgi:hypothetical protein